MEGGHSELGIGPFVVYGKYGGSADGCLRADLHRIGYQVLVVWQYRGSALGCLALSISSIEDLLSDVGCYCWVGLIMHGFR